MRRTIHHLPSTVLLGVVLLTALPPCRLGAQTLSVVATTSFRPTAVLAPHVRYVVAVDSQTGLLGIRDLAVPPVAFGTIRVEGAQPFAREATPRAFDDTARFEPDGRVLLLRGDQQGRPPFSVEVVGARGAAGGRLVISAPRWPLSRVLLVTITPADIYELGWGAVGFGVRDRIRVDDRAGMAFLSDSTAGATTVAIGFGRGASGRIQSDVADVLLRRDLGGQVGLERRRVGALTLAIEPARDEAGDARAEVIFGVGDSEAEAMQAARAAGAESPAPPTAAALRARTPDDDVDVALRHLLAAAGWQLDWDRLGGERALPVSAWRPAVRAADAWRAAVVAHVRGDTSAACGSYRLLRSGTTPATGTHAEVALRLGARGRYLGAADSAAGAAGADAGLVLLGYACYRSTRNAAWLQAEMPALVAASTRASRDIAEPAVPEMLRRLAEIDNQLAELSGGQRISRGDSLRALATELEGARSTITPAEAWQAVRTDARRALARDYGRMAGAADPGGLSLAAGGRFLDELARGLFGIDEHLDHVDIAPRLEGIADDRSWQLDGWLLAAGDTLGIAYRPADRAVRVRLAASRGWRVVLRFPWLVPSSCVTIRRAVETERAPLVMLADGSAYVNVRATFDPAEVRVTAAECPS